MISANRILVTDDETVIAALWAHEECILLERHCNKDGLPISESWIVSSSFRVPDPGLKIGEKTA